MLFGVFCVGLVIGVLFGVVSVFGIFYGLVYFLFLFFLFGKNLKIKSEI